MLLDVPVRAFKRFLVLLKPKPRLFIGNGFGDALFGRARNVNV
jgi:hypothetical protein